MRRSEQSELGEFVTRIGDRGVAVEQPHGFHRECAPTRILGGAALHAAKRAIDAAPPFSRGNKLIDIFGKQDANGSGILRRLQALGCDA